MLRLFYIVICIGIACAFAYNFRHTTGRGTRPVLYFLLAFCIAYDIESFYSSMTVFFEALTCLSIGFGAALIIYQLTSLAARTKKGVYILLPFDLLLTALCVSPIIIKKCFSLRCFDFDCVFALMQTNVSETLDMLGAYVSLPVILLAVATLAVIGIAFAIGGTSRVSMKATLAFCLLGAVAVAAGASKSTAVVKIRDIHNVYSDNLALMNVGANEDYSGFVPGPEFPDSITVAIVVGESMSRDYLSAYGYEVNTTPALKQMVEDSVLIRFDNPYSSAIFTVHCMMGMLSTAWQEYPMPEHLLVNLLNHLGYDSWWIASEDMMGLSPMLVLQRAAAHQLPNTKAGSYDMDLLPLLQQAFDAEAPRKLVVCKLMGSHVNYVNRYEKDVVSRENTGNADNALFEYENSLMYTDAMLSRLIDMARDRKNFILIYLSDHGEKPGTMRLYDNFDFSMARIPMLVYFSDDLRESHAYGNLVANSGKYWVADLLFNMVCGMLDIHNDAVLDPRLDLSGDGYAMTPEELKICNYTRTLASDPHAGNSEQ